MSLDPKDYPPKGFLIGFKWVGWSIYFVLFLVLTLEYGTGAWLLGMGILVSSYFASAASRDLDEGKYQ